DILSRLHIFSDISDQTMEQVRQYTGKDWLVEYPHESKNEAIKDTWFGAMSYAYLEGGFDKRAVGRIIRLRIEQGLETNIHDASQWLATFKLPETAYDTQKIKSERDKPGFEPEAFEPEIMHSKHLEQQFLSSLLASEPELRKRLLLSAKDGVAETLF